MVTVLLTPSKAPLRSSASAALMRIPKEAEAQLLAAVRGDGDYGKMGEAFGPDKTHLAILADSLDAVFSRP